MHKIVGIASLLLLAWGAQGLRQAGNAALAAAVPGSEEADRVTHLPGAPDTLDFDLYSGYVTVDEEAGRALFYVLAESSGDAAADPLVLWLNGGPGCSSLGGGFMSELGPFDATNSSQLARNDYAWNRAANMLFLESPAFVGWSYSNTSADADVGDARTAADSYRFLRGFLRRFPRYAGRPLWLSGESYGGHYLPNLAREIVNGNAHADSDEGRVNFQGFLVGNALTVPEVDSRGAVQFWWTHGMISTRVRDGMEDHCDFAAIYPLAGQSEYASASAATSQRPAATAVGDPLPRRLAATARRRRDDDEKCAQFVDQAMSEFAGINIYDIYADVCLAPGGNASVSSSPSYIAAAQRVRQLALMLRDHPAGTATRPALNQPSYDPCIDNEVEMYFNRPDVQRALHANLTGDLPGPWQTCTQAIRYSRQDLLASMLPLYEELLDAGLRILVYTGDVDAIVPVIGTRNWIESLGLEVEAPWRAWRSATGQVGGWTVDYARGLSFASVRGAGHMVPYVQPERAFHLFSRWLRGEPL